VPEKCPDLLIKAFQALQSKHWKLVFVGGNAGNDSFTAKLYRLTAANPNILFTGELRGTRLAEIMRGAGLFVLPSDLEGSPLALLEAMREKIPVIASNISAHQELLQIDKGLLFKKGDFTALQERLQWALCNPRDMSDRAERAHEAILSHHSWHRVSSELIRIYASLWGLTVESKARERVIEYQQPTQLNGR
jgi:glycosyltransferase involved in cell wall biosynthesis